MYKEIIWDKRNAAEKNYNILIPFKNKFKKISK